MKRVCFVFAIIALSGCTTQQKLAYFNNLSETGKEETFTMSIPDYKLLPRDVLYITAKAMTSEGNIMDFLSTPRSSQSISISQTEGEGSLYGYDINFNGCIILPVIGEIKVSGHSLEEAQILIQERVDSIFKNATVECKLLSFKFTVIGEVRSPGSFINYNKYLTVLEAIGRAGGIGDYGRRNNLLIIRPVDGATKTFRLNLQDKALFTSEEYFVYPNDVIIVQPESKKLFNLNFPTFSAILATATSLLSTTLLLINYFGK